ncbi:uncharacterized protein LOC118433664 [Folsomia candida]|nr:uncharacterized protein LOC118433664 [Folsomia candida]
MAPVTTIPIFAVIVLILISVVQENEADEGGCPSDCVCFTEYLSNLQSWKWIETDVNVQKDDPFHEDFNPYTEHNEVYDNPAAVRRRQKEKILSTATCMLRTNSSSALAVTLARLGSSLQILSLLQAPGSGQISLEKTHLSQMQDLIGLEIQGYSISSAPSSLSIAPDAFSNLGKLTYLSLERVTLLQGDAASSSTTKYNFTYGSEYVDDEQIIIVKSKPDSSSDTIVPYSVYREEQQQQSKTPPHPVDPKITVAFTNLASLQHLRISSSPLQDISWDMFHKLDSLGFLLLDDNDLLFLPDFVFYSTPNLGALSLSRNRILNLQTVGLAGLLTLQKLDVSYNNITYLSELSLPPFPHLEVADFRHNPITSIFPNTFEIMNSTKTLFLGSESTQLEISTNSFFGLVALTRLDILNVHVEFLERPMLKGMPNLKSLTATGTITRIMYDAFSEVAKLEKLILKDCAIKKISMDAFFGLTALVELDLSHNEIGFLPPGIFEQQVSLREVFLQHNSLKTLPPSIFAKIPAKLIRLEGNPWHCSCDMKYWDPSQTNKIKRYHVPPPNGTFCDPQFFKAAACYANYEPKFEAKYVYEKRVSPVCQAPSDFKGKSVFEVLKKGLHNVCTNSLQQNISILLTSSNPTETLEIMGTVRIPTEKEIEKKLLFPEKVRKPRPTSAAILEKVNMSTDPYFSSSSGNGMTSISSTTHHLIIPPTISIPMVLNSPSPPPLSPQEEEETNKRRKPNRKNGRNRPPPNIEEHDMEVEDNRINVLWSPQANGADVRPRTIYPISKKALQYMKVQQKRQQQQQRQQQG